MQVYTKSNTKYQSAQELVLLEKAGHLARVVTNYMKKFFDR